MTPQGRLDSLVRRLDAREGSWTDAERDAYERRLTEAFLRAMDRKPERELPPGLQKVLAAAESAPATPGWEGPGIDPAKLDAAVRESVRQRRGRPFIVRTARDVLMSPEYRAIAAERRAQREEMP
jgi:hypothetical protein